MNSNDPINAYYNLLIAIVKQALTDYVNNRLHEDSFETFLHNFFSDDGKVELIMKRAKYLKYRKEKKREERNNK